VVPVILHPPRRGNVTWVGNFLPPPEFGAVGQRHSPLECGAFLDQLALVFGERSQDPNHHAASSGAGVDAVSCRDQCDAALGQSLNGLKDVQGVAAPQPIQLPHHHGVALADIVHQGRQARTVILCPRQGVGEGLRHASSRKGGVLLLQRVGYGADSHITYAHPTTWCGCMRISVCHRLIQQPRSEIYSRDGFLRHSG
jgi:hypothetical protein